MEEKIFNGKIKTCFLISVFPFSESTLQLLRMQAPAQEILASCTGTCALPCTPLCSHWVCTNNTCTGRLSLCMEHLLLYTPSGCLFSFPSSFPHPSLPLLGHPASIHCICGLHLPGECNLFLYLENPPGGCPRAGSHIHQGPQVVKWARSQETVSPLHTGQ